MKRYILAAVVALMASQAQAASQNFWPRAYLGVEEDSSQITSSTVLNNVDIEYGATGVNIILSSSVPGISASLQQITSDETDQVVIVSETIGLSPVPVSRTLMPPIFAYSIKVSPSVPLTGSQTIHMNVQQAK